MAAQLRATAPDVANADQSLPDPTKHALGWLGALLALAAIVAIGLNAAGLTGAPFDPPRGDFNFALFAGFYAAAQIIERLMELVVPFLPVKLPALPAGATSGDRAARAAQVKADRAKMALGLATLLGVAASCGFGLFFLETIGIHTPSNTIDGLATGIVIAAGTKPLHDFISLLQNRDNPRTGSDAV